MSYKSDGNLILKKRHETKIDMIFLRQYVKICKETILAQCILTRAIVLLVLSVLLRFTGSPNIS